MLYRPVEQFSDEWRQHVHIVLQKISWKWVCGTLLLRKFADGSDDVIIGEDVESGIAKEHFYTFMVTISQFFHRLLGVDFPQRSTIRHEK